MAESQTPLKVSEVTEALQSVAEGQSNLSALIDRIWASTRHPEKVVDLARIKEGRKRAPQLVDRINSTNHEPMDRFEDIR